MFFGDSIFPQYFYIRLQPSRQRYHCFNPNIFREVAFLGAFPYLFNILYHCYRNLVANYTREKNDEQRLQQAGKESNYDRRSELKSFDDSKLSVKGLVDVGLTKILWMVIHVQRMTNMSWGSKESPEGIQQLQRNG